MMNIDDKKLIEERNYNNHIIWITGLSGVGKSTLAREVSRQIRMRGEPVVILDGDELREIFGAAETNSKNHGREGRINLGFQYAYLCRLLANQGLTVVIATISLFKEIHKWNRKNLPGYFEVYLKVPLEELRLRDTKGIYRRFEAGELSEVAGMDIPIDEPEEPDLIVEFDPTYTVEKLADDILIIMMKDLK